MSGSSADDERPEDGRRRWLDRSSRRRRRKRLAGFELLQHAKRKKALTVLFWFAALGAVAVAIVLLIPT